MSKGKDLIERLRAKLPGIQTPMMNGDNLAVTLCSHFDNPEQPDDETGWSEDAVRGYTEVIDAIHAHYASTIASLSEALAEAEKKGGEDGWMPIETAPRDGTSVLLGRFTGQKGAKNEGHICVDWWRRPEDEMGYVGFGFFNPTHWPATHWRPLPAPPAKRTKSQ